MHTGLCFICLLKWTSSNNYFIKVEFDEFAHSSIRQNSWEAWKERRTNSAAGDIDSGYG